MPQQHQQPHPKQQQVQLAQQSTSQEASPGAQRLPNSSQSDTTNQSASNGAAQTLRSSSPPPPPPTADNQSQRAGSAKATKLNGLKNRIIQRPPPLILDKVSNFYDNELDQQQQSQQPQQQVSTNLPNPQSTIGSLHTDTNTNHQQQQQQTQTHSANHKFWASLNNQNASRNKVAAMRSLPANSLLNNTQSFEHKKPVQQRIGSDLIISHRSTSSISVDAPNHTGSQPIVPSNRISKSTALLLQQQQLHQQQMMLLQRRSATPTASERATLHERGNTITPTPSEPSQILLTDSHESSIRGPDQSNNSELDDSSTHGGLASDHDGGNLIGVDNHLPTPPPLAQNIDPVTLAHQSVGDHHDYQRIAPAILQAPPVSASSNRPRSTNPFLVMDDETITELSNQHSSNGTNDSQQKKPASIVVATNINTEGLSNHNNQNQQLPEHQQQVVPQKQFSDLHLAQEGSAPQAHMRSSYKHHQMYNNDEQSAKEDLIYGQIGDRRAIIIDHDTNPIDQRDSTSYRSSIISQQQDQSIASIYGVYPRHYDNHYNISGYHEPTISIDSESTICKPPPSATMQLPHWTEAIYELNNAIIDLNSVAGGAENGKFIYIVDNGDIILELDHVKVSGLTLVDFNDLLESKQVHLLNAVQTKHSHGISTDLKQYLNCSFPKNSHDKNLQDLIRENIYRRTIPCTTRPPKDGEINKVDYHFLTKEHFIEMNNAGMLLECGIFGGHYYGTMKPFSDLNSLTIYGSTSHKELSVDMCQPLNANHPAIGMSSIKKDNSIVPINPNQNENPLYENQESLKLLQMHQIVDYKGSRTDENFKQKLVAPTPDQRNSNTQQFDLDCNLISSDSTNHQPNMFSVDTDALPSGWERVIDQTHGTYYIDHNTQRTQYERPYEIELTKSSMGFGFTLVEADNGILLVRSIIPNGPAHLNGMIKPGDILISAVGVSVANLQHTDIARLFSTFAVGDSIRLTLARSTYVVDANLIPDEYLFSNGTNGDLAVAVNPSYFNQHYNHLHHLSENNLSENLSDNNLSQNLSDTPKPPMKFSNINGQSQINQYNNFMNNDRLVMMQMQQQQQQQRQQHQRLHQPSILQSHSVSTMPTSADYSHMPLYSNSDMLRDEAPPVVPVAPVRPYHHQYVFEPYFNGDASNSYYANNEEIALQRVQYETYQDMTAAVPPSNGHQLPGMMMHLQPNSGSLDESQDEADKYEYHQVDLDRDSRDSNWGIRLIGGSEVDRATSIGSIVFGGAASKNGKLKSGDEIISINGYNVVGATHQHVVDLISACANRASLVVRRMKFAEACEVVLNRNMDEGFGFVIISSHNCALIGSIIPGSPAARCQQLHVKDRIIAVNGNYITSDMQHPDIVNLIKECGSTLRLRIIPADCYTVELIKSSQQDNFGFSMRGGSEYDGTPLYILRVAPKGLARDLLNVGDQIIEINNIPTVGMTHQQAATIIKYSDPIVKLKLRRNYEIPPSLLVASPKELSKYNQVKAEMTTISDRTSTTPVNGIVIQ